MSTEHNHLIIMAGGIGSRFWPLSTPTFPKQFIDILGCGRTLIQLTSDRFSGLFPKSNIWVVTNEKYVGIVQEQLPDIQESHILAEPAARNTAPCIAWACWRIFAEDSEANVVVTPSDAIVMNVRAFCEAIKESLCKSSESKSIVTIGITPTRPETGYGYVEMGQDTEGDSVRPAASFKEKPNLEVAKMYLSSGRFVWNAGIFVSQAATLIEALREFAPQIAEIMDRISLAPKRTAELFPQCDKISIDYAVMEPAAAKGSVFTRPVECGWSDLGNWASIYDRISHDENGNASVGSVNFHECKDCIVHAEEAEKVVLQGLEGYIVSLKGGKLLVCKRSEEQRITEFSSQN